MSASRYEVLPFGTAESEAASAGRRLTITVTCSPRHGIDRTVAVATRIAALGHHAIPHVAARSLRDVGHLDAVLDRLADAGLDDVFLVAGDAVEPEGPFASAVALLPLLVKHPARPRRIGIAAYPEGHPLIGPQALAESLERKARLADYVVTQMCFDPDVVVRWLEDARARGLALPVYVGVPGDVDRRRLLEVSMRVGVGASIAFLRGQRGIGRLLGRPHHAAERLHDAFAPVVGEPGLGIAGLHFFTFNCLTPTLAWEVARNARPPSDNRLVADA